MPTLLFECLELGTPEQWPSEASDPCWLYQTLAQTLQNSAVKHRFREELSHLDGFMPTYDDSRGEELDRDISNSVRILQKSMKKWVQQKMQKSEKHSEDVRRFACRAVSEILDVAEEGDAAVPISLQPVVLESVKAKFEEIIRLAKEQRSATSEDSSSQEDTEETMSVEPADPISFQIYLQHMQEKMRKVFKIMVRRLDGVPSTLKGKAEILCAWPIRTAPISKQPMSVQRTKEWFQERFQLTMTRISTVIALQRADVTLHQLTISEDSSPQEGDTEETGPVNGHASPGNDSTSESVEAAALLDDDSSLQCMTVRFLVQFLHIINSIDFTIDMQWSMDAFWPPGGDTDETVSTASISSQSADVISQLSVSSEDSWPPEGDTEETVPVVAAASISPQLTFLQRMRERFQKLIQQRKRRITPAEDHVSAGNKSATESAASISPQLTFLQRMRKRFQKLIQRKRRITPAEDHVSAGNKSATESAASISPQLTFLQRMRKRFQKLIQQRKRRITPAEDHVSAGNKSATESAASISPQSADVISQLSVSSEDSWPPEGDTDETLSAASISSQSADVISQLSVSSEDSWPPEGDTDETLSAASISSLSADVISQLSVSSEDSWPPEGDTDETLSAASISSQSADVISQLSVSSEDSWPPEGDTEETVPVAAAASISPQLTFLQRMRKRFQKLIQQRKRRITPAEDHLSAGNKLATESAASISPQLTFLQRMRERFQKLIQQRKRRITPAEDHVSAGNNPSLDYHWTCSCCGPLLASSALTESVILSGHNAGSGDNVQVFIHFQSEYGILSGQNDTT
ncbi:uncharacterized protein V6R79_024157 [Siganus canaliculatus]